MRNRSLTIYSTGVYLQTVKYIINGKKQWRWVAVGFEDDSFLNGQVINPIIYTDKDSGMVNKFGEN